MKKIIILLAVVFFGTLSVCYAQTTKRYNYVSLTRQKIRDALTNTAFDHFVFSFWLTEKGYELKGVAYTAGFLPIGTPFDLPAYGNRHENLRNYQRGIFRLSRALMEEFGITADIASNVVFQPVKSEKDGVKIDFVSYELIWGGQPLIGKRLNPSPPF